MDIEKYKKAKRLEEELSPIIDIVNLLNLHIEMPGMFNEGHFEFVTNTETLPVPRVLNGEILPIIAKYGEKLKKQQPNLPRSRRLDARRSLLILTANS